MAIPTLEDFENGMASRSGNVIVTLPQTTAA
jgi:hypothetical protein